VRIFFILFCFILGTCSRGLAQTLEVKVNPEKLRLQGPVAQYSLLVEGKDPEGQVVDMTRQAKYRTLNLEVAEVDEGGVIRAKADGATQVEVEINGQKRLVQVLVQGTKGERSYHFENDITPLLNRFGCNSSGCHGSAEGQNGFRLSVFGFDPVADHTALVKESRGRRILATTPEHSLFLAKASGKMPHGGGIRIPVGTAEYETLRGWVRAGMPMGDPAAPRVTGIHVEPRERQLVGKGQQQLRVVARYSDGREVDVTHHARFQSNNEGLASVNLFGLVSASEVPGEAAIMASFMGEVATFRVLIPRPEKIAHYPKAPRFNFLDDLVDARLKKLNIIPSEVCDDAEFLRRVYLDVIGTLPTSQEARNFLADKRGNKREKLVDDLLQRPEYADYWSLKWADLLRVDRQALGHKRAYGYYRWIRESLASNQPFDQFVRELLTADGPLDQNGPANFFRVVPKPGEAASTLSQVFLGVRIACAECHHHPFDRWSQTDYFGMQAFFTPVTVKASPRGDYVLTRVCPGHHHARSIASGGSAHGASGVDDETRQSLVCQEYGESVVVPFFGARPRRTGG
jgi:hypothetical protein